MVELELDTPSDCAKKLLNGEVDLGLVPVAVIPDLPGAQIISNYCIGANGPVESVCLFSEVPLDQIETVMLDYQSRTSVQLVRYLAKHRWNIKPKWERADADFIDRITGKTAAVVIGDRAFPLLKEFPFVYDLSEEWKEETGLPFVFACWVSSKKLDDEFLLQFEEALANGLVHRKEAVFEMADSDHENLVRYVDSIIDYDLDEKKRQAMKLFLDWLSKPI